MPHRPREGFKKKDTTERVPPEIAYAFKHGKGAYLVHPGFPEGTADCFKVYLICGILINHPDAAAKMWAEHREALLKRPGIESWYGFKKFEKRSKRVCCDEQ